MTEPIALTVKDVVRLTGMNRTRVYELLKSGRISGRKVGRRTLILYGSLRQFIDDAPAYMSEAA